MNDPDQTVLPEKAMAAARDWFVRRQRGFTPQERARFEAWANASDDNRRALEVVERNWQTSRHLAASSIGTNRSLPRAPFLLRRSTHAGAIGLVAIALVLVVSLGLAGRIGPYPVSASAQAATYETRLGEIKSFALSDGTRITLDTNSKVRVDLSAESRMAVLEKGRARFVAGEDSRPLIVEVSQGSIVARRATFDVSQYDNVNRASVLTGSITLHPKQTPAAELWAGQQARFEGPATAVPQVQEQWVNGILGFSDTPLAEAIGEVNRYNSMKIRLISNDGRKRLVSGGFRARDPMGFARAVATIFGLRITRSDQDTLELSS